MKKKNVVKRERGEKKTYERTPIKVQKTTVNKQSTVIESVVDVHEEKETIKKQHIVNYIYGMNQ